MSVSPPLQISLNFITFMANLIDRKQINTVLVLYDQTTRNSINNLIESLASRNDVAWVLANEFDNPDYWNRTIIQDENMLILTALHTENIFPLLNRLYNDVGNIVSPLNKRSKNLIVFSEIFKMGKELLSSLLRIKINAVLVDWTSSEVLMYAWNPYSTKPLVALNETEFLHAANDLTRGKYVGLFFDQLQDIQGNTTEVFALYDSMNVYNVISKDSVVGIDGTDIQFIDLIGKAIQSPMVFVPVNPTYLYQDNINMKQFYNFLERSYKTYAPIQQRRIERGNNMRLALLFMAENVIGTPSITIFDNIPSNLVYPHNFENFVIIVENNMIKTTTSALYRMLMSPLIYLWLLFIVLFVVIRCGLQWIYLIGATDSATKRRRCVYMCQDTVQLSCGVVMHEALFTSQRYRHALIAHGATIIPIIAGMFISGLLYGDFMMQSEVPSIDSIKQLEESNLAVMVPFYSDRDFIGLKNKQIQIPYHKLYGLIWSGNTSCAYIIPERYISMLDVDHLQSNGRPMFHVMKERYVGKYVNLFAPNWFIRSRISTIAMRCQEHGLVKYFESVSKRTFKQAATKMRTLTSKSFVATAGGLEEILIACVIYCVGISCGLVVFILEYFSRRN